MSTIGYKYAHTREYIKVLVTLEIPEDACHNMNRPNIASRQFAKHRCNKAFVLDIVDVQTGQKYQSANSCYKTSFKYNVNQWVYEDDYDPFISIIYTRGIHFFLDKRLAIHVGNCEHDDTTNLKQNPFTDNGLLWSKQYLHKFI